jgi:hypothetical protein
LAQVIECLVANTAAHDRLDLGGALAQALPHLQNELEAALPRAATPSTPKGPKTDSAWLQAFLRSQGKGL